MLKFEDFKLKEIKTNGLKQLNGGVHCVQGEEYYESDTYAISETVSTGSTIEV